LTNLKLKSEVSAPAAGVTPQTPFLRSTSSPMKPRTGEEDFARLPAFELEGLFGAVLRPPPCTLLITHKGKQMGFLLTLDIDEELANVIIEICSAWEEEEEGQNSFKSVVSRHAHVQNMAQNAQYVAMVAEYARRFAVRRDEIFEGDDFRQLHGFVRVVYGADGQWRAPSGRLDSDLLFQMFSASPRCAWSKPGTLFWGSKLPCHVQGGNMKCCGNKIFPEPPSLPPHSHPRVAADAQRAATMIIQEKMARDKDKGRRRAKGKFAAAAVDDCPIDPENPEHVQILQEELAKMMSDPVQYKASVKLMKRRGGWVKRKTRGEYRFMKLIK